MEKKAYLKVYRACFSLGSVDNRKRDSEELDGTGVCARFYAFETLLSHNLITNHCNQSLALRHYRDCEIFYHGQRRDWYHICGERSFLMTGPWYLAVFKGTRGRISVKMPCGRILKVEVKLRYTVRDVKAVVESIVGSPVDPLSVAYNGVRLHDLKNLSLYDATEESMLEMVPKGIQIFVECHCGITWYGVHTEDLVMNLKKKIVDEEGFRPDGFRLVFEGHFLLDDRALASYNMG